MIRQDGGVVVSTNTSPPEGPGFESAGRLGAGLSDSVQQVID